jgi:hypothetical protein
VVARDTTMLEFTSPGTEYGKYGRKENQSDSTVLSLDGL